MPNRIAMTPGGEIEWDVHESDDEGVLYLPPNVTKDAYNILLEDEWEDAKRTRDLHPSSPQATTVHIWGTTIVRCRFFAPNVSFNEVSSTSVSWLRANIMLGYGFEQLDEEERLVYIYDEQSRLTTLRIKTPEYFGYRVVPVEVGGSLCHQVIYLMSDESVGREHPDGDEHLSLYWRPLQKICGEAWAAGQYPTEMGPYIDASNELNFFKGKEDGVVLDVNSGFNLTSF